MLGDYTMKAINLKDKIDKYCNRQDLKIPKAHLETVCKIRQKKDTCKYICLLPDGYICVKKTDIKEAIDEAAKEKRIIALGDNCEGLGNER